MNCCDYCDTKKYENCIGYPMCSINCHILKEK